MSGRPSSFARQPWQVSTLRLLKPEEDTLETVFLRLTGKADSELSEERRSQRQGDGA